MLRLSISYEYYTNVCGICTGTARLHLSSVARRYLQTRSGCLYRHLITKGRNNIVNFTHMRVYLQLSTFYQNTFARLIIILEQSDGNRITLHDYDIFLIHFLYSNEESFLYFYFINRHVSKARNIMRIDKITECRYYLGKWVSARITRISESHNRDSK